MECAVKKTLFNANAIGFKTLQKLSKQTCNHNFKTSELDIRESFQDASHNQTNKVM
jgi:hypothetical protein